MIDWGEIAMGQIAWTELAAGCLLVLLALAGYDLCIVRPLRRRMAGLVRRAATLDAFRIRATGALQRLARAQQAAAQEASRIEERLGQIELRGDSRAYEQAINLASHGGSADRLVSYFGLTEGEASLVRLLHGSRDDKNASQ